MKLIFSAFAALVGTSTAVEQAIDATCVSTNTRGTLTLKIAYTHNDPASEILSLSAGSCTSPGDATFSQTATHAIVEIDIAKCELDKEIYENRLRTFNLRAGYFTTEATVELGRKNPDDGTLYSLYKATIKTECGTETKYQAVFDYGSVSHMTSSDELRPGTYNKMTFTINEYTDDTFSTVVTNAPAKRLAGEKIYLRVAESSSNPHYKFVVPQCTMTNNEQSTALSLFKHDEHRCGNDFLELVLNAQRYTFDITHTVAVFGNGSESTYKLTCDVLLCEDDDTAGLCGSVATNCDL